MDQLLALIRNAPDCHFSEAANLPNLDPSYVLPADVQQFYETCGGLLLAENSEYPIRIVPPERFVQANPVIIGELCEEDISAAWFIIAEYGSDSFLTIDLDPERNGRCYDSFWDRHGVAGSCRIIATSFTDLLSQLFTYRGQYWYWLCSDFESPGDAYD